MQELPLHLLLEKRQHVHLSYIKNLSQRDQRRENRERERERERERGENTSDFEVPGN